MNRGEELGVAVCAHTFVQSTGSAELEFSLAWDMPVIHFGANEYSHMRYFMNPLYENKTNQMSVSKDIVASQQNLSTKLILYLLTVFVCGNAKARSDQLKCILSFTAEYVREMLLQLPYGSPYPCVAISV